MTCAPSEDSDQPGHPPSMISLHCPHEETLGPWLPIERTAKTLLARVISVFTGRMCHFDSFFLVRRLIYHQNKCCILSKVVTNKNQKYSCQYLMKVIMCCLSEIVKVCLIAVPCMCPMCLIANPGYRMHLIGRQSFHCAMYLLLLDLVSKNQLSTNQNFSTHATIRGMTVGHVSLA